MNIAINAVVPLLILIFLGYLSRRLNILKSGDERVLAAYVYYFALPSLFVIEISKIKFTEKILLFIITGFLPLLILLAAYAAIYKIFKMQRSTFYLISLSTIFGSLAFFGIPFITFAMPAGEKLATLAAGMISMIAVSIAITMLEMYGIKEVSKSIRKVARRLLKNPLIISILIGLLFSLLDIKLPYVAELSLHMLGRSTSVVAIFMLGVFLYGGKYKNLNIAFGLTLPRMILLPTVTFIITILLHLNKLQTTIIVLMNAMPMAVSMMILSHRYKFYEDIIASTIMISSLTSIIYLNIWLLFLASL